MGFLTLKTKLITILILGTLTILYKFVLGAKDLDDI